MICDSADPYSGSIRYNATKSLFYARMDLRSFDLSEPSLWPDLDDFSALILCTEALHRLDERKIDSIRRFVSLGGGLVVAYRGWSVALADLFGVPTYSKWPQLVAGETEGLCFPTDFFPAFGGLQLSHDELSGHTSYDLIPVPETTIIATSEGGRPLAWFNRFGEGRVVYWNTVVLGEKTSRGLIVQSIAAVQPVSVLPIANIATVQIDDYPPEMFEQTLEPISREYPNMSNLEFYDQIWFGDMVSLARKHALRYTWLCVFDYDDDVQPSELEFDATGHRPSTAEVSPFNVAAAQAAADEGELGLHGYNHFPLLLEHWETSGKMVKALQVSSVQWTDSGLGPLPTTYVPPINQYDKAGARALSQVYPEMNAICGFYSGGDFERGENREFGPEPWNPDLFCFPRATSGYALSGMTRFVLASQIGTMGVWTHFLHTDDVYETPENFPDNEHWRNAQSLPWRADQDGHQTGLFHQFERGIAFVRKTFPWLTFLETREAVPIVKSFLENDVQVHYSANAITLIATHPCCFQVRINDGRRLNPVGLSHVEILDTQIGSTFALYTLRSAKPEIRLEII
ncbi:MAG: DUF2194 domain-containing protein [Alphaproteobacteria bacterium]|nr:DUF2194 domain-containing protein [Alphaproteobacteria bacterium]